MKFEIAKSTLPDIKADALIVWHFQADKALSASAAQIDRACGGMIQDVLKKGDFTGKKKERVMLYAGQKAASPRVVLVGLGERSQLEPDAIRTAFAEGLNQLRSLKVKTLGTCLDFGETGVPASASVAAALEGLILGDYRYQVYKTHDREQTPIERVLIAGGGWSDPGAIRAGIAIAESVGMAACFARDLGNAPGNALTPSILARIAEQTARSRKIKCTVLDRAKIKKAGMNALLGVAQGSHEPPSFIVLEYYGAGRKGDNIVLIGKGITFDSGGISLKPSDKMGEMKADMAGAAAVIAAVRAAAELRLPLNIVGLVPATENMPGGGAYRPGDILTSLKGKTIEIITTDAEGRLILADTLTYAERFKPAVMIDIATLTGACTVALGEEVAGLFSSDEELKNGLIAASRSTGEKIWELPLWDCYRDLIKSDVADLKNSGGRNGGASSAASFLSCFAGSCRWAHIDIAGPGFSTKDKTYIPKGATGFGVRLIVQFLIDRCRTE